MMFREPMPKPLLTVLLAHASSALLVAALALPCAAQTSPAPAAQAPEEASANASGGTPALIELRSGQGLWALIESHDPDGLWLRRIDQGGRVHVPWGSLRARQSDELRRAFGYAEAEGEPPLVQAERVPLTDGKEAIGVILHHSDGALHLKTANALLAIPKSRIAGPSSPVQVPALDVYTRDELYDMYRRERAAELAAPGAAAAPAHARLARDCERMLDFAHAVQHYELALQADPQYEAEALRAAAARAKQKLAAQAQLDALSAIDTLRRRGQFDAALALSADFRQRNPNTPLAPEAKALHERVLKAQQRELRDRIAEVWFRQTERVVRDASRELGYQAALAWIEAQLPNEVVGRVVEELKPISRELTPELAQSLFAARTRGRLRKASYGLGTWLLGEQRARKGLDPEAEAKAQAERDGKSSAQQQLADNLKRYLENQELARKAASGAGDPEDDPEAHWNQMNVSERTQWLLAYWVEHGGLAQLVRVTGEPCPSCAGTGLREVAMVGTGKGNAGGGGGTRQVPCPTCHTIGVIRRVVYR